MSYIKSEGIDISGKAYFKVVVKKSAEIMLFIVEGFCNILSGKIRVKIFCDIVINGKCKGCINRCVAFHFRAGQSKRTRHIKTSFKHIKIRRFNIEKMVGKELFYCIIGPEFIEN